MGNGQFKLLFPSHAMPFSIPKAEIPAIVSRVNLILKDMEKKGLTKTGGFSILASDGSGTRIHIDMPIPGDWILVDVDYSTVIYEAFAKDMVRGGGTYMVLPMKVAGLNAVDLKAACARATVTPASPPPVYQAKATGTVKSATTSLCTPYR